VSIAPAARRAGHHKAFAAGAAVLVAAGLLVTMRDRIAPPPTEAEHASAPTDAIPVGALLVVTTDLARMRASGFAERLQASSREVPGLGDLRQACGFDPFETFDAAAFAIPNEGADGDFGIAVLGTKVQSDQLLACTTKVIEALGGKPLASRLGSFDTVRDVGSGAPAGEIAARPAGPFLLGAGSYLRAMVDAADGRVPSVHGEGAHARLAGALGGSPVVTATLVLGARQRATIADEIARAGAGAPPAIARVAAAAISVETKGDRVGLHAIFACDDARGALEVAHAIEDLRLARKGAPLARLSGMAGLLTAIQVEVERDFVHARLVLPVAEAEALLGLLLDGARSSARPAPPMPRYGNPPPAATTASASPAASATTAPSASAAPSAPGAAPKKKPSPRPAVDEPEIF